jgi:hypothetical protein
VKMKTQRLAGKDNILVETVKFVKKEVGGVENKLRAEAKAIAIQYTILGVAIGTVAGIVGTAIWERYVSPPSTQRPVA